jgi:hypothetical protein
MFDDGRVDYDERWAIKQSCRFSAKLEKQICNVSGGGQLKRSASESPEFLVTLQSQSRKEMAG